MAKNNHITNSFVAGEVSPKFFGRTEVVQYNQACEKIFNAIVDPQGGAGNRPGTKLVRKITNYDATTVPDAAVVIPFSGADGTEWVLCLTSESPDQPAGYTGPPDDATNKRWNWFAINKQTHDIEFITAFFDVHTTLAKPWYFDDYYEGFVGRAADIHYAQTGDQIVITNGGAGLANGNYRPIIITYDPTPPSAAYSSFTMHSFPRYEKLTGIDTPTYVGLRQMPFEAAIVSTVALSIEMVVTAGVPMTIAPGAGSGIVFDADWHGKYIKFTKAAEACIVMVYDVDSASSAKVIKLGGAIAGTVTDTYGGATAANYYEEGYWDEAKGWPTTVTFFENRMVFGGTKTYPDSLWLAQINDINEFDRNRLVTDSDYADAEAEDDPFSTNLKAEVLAKIQWLSPGKTIAAGTAQREFVLQGPSPTTTLSSVNQQSQAETSQGSARAMALRVENAIIFMQKDRRTLRELAFNFNEDSFKADNLNIMAEHMGRKFIETVTPATNPGKPYFLQLAKQNDIIWVLNNSGALCGLTRSREQNVAAWHYHELAGYGPEISATQYSQPIIRSICSGPREPANWMDQGSEDVLWMTVERGEPDGTRFMAIEALSLPWDRDVIWEESIVWETGDEPCTAPIYMDCAFLTDATTQRLGPYSNGPGIISGLPHGDTAEVSVVVNGHYIGEYTVDVDEIDISDAISDYLNVSQADDNWQAMVGFKYTAQIVPVCPEVPANTGSSQGQLRRVDQISVHLYNTVGVSIGRLDDNVDENTPVDSVEEVVFPEGTNQDDPIPLFTGVKTVNFPQGWERRPRILIQTDKPLPMHVTHIVARMNVSE